MPIMTLHQWKKYTASSDTFGRDKELAAFDLAVEGYWKAFNDFARASDKAKKAQASDTVVKRAEDLQGLVRSYKAHHPTYRTQGKMKNLPLGWGDGARVFDEAEYAREQDEKTRGVRKNQAIGDRNVLDELEDEAMEVCLNQGTVALGYESRAEVRVAALRDTFCGNGDDDLEFDINALGGDFAKMGFVSQAPKLFSRKLTLVGRIVGTSTNAQANLVEGKIVKLIHSGVTGIIDYMKGKLSNALDAEVMATIASATTQCVANCCNVLAQLSKSIGAGVNCVANIAAVYTNLDTAYNAIRGHKTYFLDSMEIESAMDAMTSAFAKEAALSGFKALWNGASACINALAWIFGLGAITALVTTVLEEVASLLFELYCVFRDAERVAKVNQAIRCRFQVASFDVRTFFGDFPLAGAYFIGASPLSRLMAAFGDLAQGGVGGLHSSYQITKRVYKENILPVKLAALSLATSSPWENKELLPKLLAPKKKGFIGKTGAWVAGVQDQLADAVLGKDKSLELLDW
jgi:hypothetical protein